MIEKRKADDRPISFLDEIKMHAQLWMTDASYRTAHRPVKDALQALLDSVTISESMNHAKEITNNDVKNTETKKMISLYKQKYLELTDYNCDEQMTQAGWIILGRLVEKLMVEGSGVEEYIEWFYEDFLKDKTNQTFLPPQMKTMMSNFIVSKYFFKNRQMFKERKRDVIANKKKLAILKIGSEMFEQFQDDRELGDMLIKYGSNKIAYSKFEGFLILYAQKSNMEGIIKRINDVRENSLDGNMNKNDEKDSTKDKNVV